ncbi:unnamed protein product, partial [Effrenium voratum]
ANLGRFSVSVSTRLVSTCEKPKEKKSKLLTCSNPGASSSRCGCGGHLQSPLLGQRVENQEWFAKNAKLKEALMSHNSWKHLEANNVLREARAWADSVSLRTSVMGSQELPSEASQADATSSASQRDAGLSSLYHSGSKLLDPRRAWQFGGSRSARLTGPNIAERHAYSCNRAVYGSVKRLLISVQWVPLIFFAVGLDEVVVVLVRLSPSERWSRWKALPRLEALRHLPSQAKPARGRSGSWQKLIEADVCRTWLAPPEQRAALARICRAFAEDELGYCQGMSLVAAVLLLVAQNEEEALQAFSGLMTRLHSFYEPGMVGLQRPALVSKAAGFG